MRHIFAYAVKQGWDFGGIIPKNHEDSYLDEAFGWTMAAIGFYFQYTIGFSVPFPMNIILLPL